MVPTWLSRRWGWVAVFVIGCGKGHLPPPAHGEPATVLEMARTRGVPDPTRARFSVKLRSQKMSLAATTGGGLVVDRPGQGRIDLFGPLGNPLITVSTDAAGLSVLLIAEERQLAAVDAEAVLRETTGGVAGLDDLLALLVGDLPFDTARVLALQRTEGGTRVLLEGTAGATVEAVLDPALGTPRSLVAANREGATLMRATYDPFVPFGDTLVPSGVELLVPSLDLAVELRYRTWDAAEPDAAVFQVVAPPGYRVESLEAAVERLLGRMAGL
jgi:hypothetical protein